MPPILRVQMTPDDLGVACNIAGRILLGRLAKSGGRFLAIGKTKDVTEQAKRAVVEHILHDTGGDMRKSRKDVISLDDGSTWYRLSVELCSAPDENMK